MIATLLWVPIALYIAGWCGVFIAYWRGEDAWPSWGRWLITVGWGAHTLLLLTRAAESGLEVPFAFSAVAWVAILVHFLAQRRNRKTVIGFILPPLAVALLLLGEVSVRSQAIGARFELGHGAVQGIVVVHIVAMLLGHLIFAAGCLFSIAYLYGEHQLKAKQAGSTHSRFPPLSTLSALNHRAIALGFFFLSLGILLGFLAGGMTGVAAEALSWRQIIPVLVWLLYAGFLLQQTYQGRRGHFSAVLSIAGFIIVTSALVFELTVLFV